MSDEVLGALEPEIVVSPPGPRSRELSLRMSAVESPAFDARREARSQAASTDQGPIVYLRGQGGNVLDVDGNRYVDLTAGFGALLLGHGVTSATQAASSAMFELPLALGDVYASEVKVRASEAIAGLFPEPNARVMLGLSGADAVTCALKTSLLATSKPRVIAFEGSYHGLSHGPLAALGFAPSFRAPFAPHLGVPVTFAPFPRRPSELDASLTAVRGALARGDVGAILVEPVLGRGGCVVPPSTLLPELRALANEYDALLILDEIWTGMGRTGAVLGLSATTDRPLVPDVICLGKGLGGGLPISACLGRASVMEAWGGHGGTRIHTGTHFGSPPSCAAALAVIHAVDPPLLARVRATSTRWFEALAPLEREGLAEISGVGLMVGVRLESAVAALKAMRALLERGYLVLTGGERGDVLTLSPSLTVDPKLLESFSSALRDVVG